MTWGVTLNLGTRSRPSKLIEWVHPLPSGIASVVIAVRPSKAPSVRRRLERLFQRRTMGESGPQWETIPHARAIAWRTITGPRGAEWWVCGPIAHNSARFEDIVATLSRRDGWRAARMLVTRKLLIVDARTGAEVGTTAPPVPALPDVDEADNDTTSGATRAA